MIVACGLATLDVVQTVDRLPGPDEKVVARGLSVGVGGPAANAAVTAVALGVAARLVTRVGAGPLGRLVTGDLAARGVAVTDLGGGEPAVSTVLVTAATGQRAVVSVNATGDVGPAAADGSAVEATVAGAEVLLVDGHHLDVALLAARAARRAGAVVLLDGGSWKPGLADLLPLVDVALLSADLRVPGGAPGGADVLRDVAELGPGVVARSQGPGPLQVLDGDDVLEVPVPVVDVVDTLGAGDVLHGALAAWLAQHAGERPTPRALLPGLAWAAEIASRSCTAPGAHGWHTPPP